MLTCLVCGRFDLYTSSDLLPVARSAVGPISGVLDLVGDPRPSADEVRQLNPLSLLFAGRAKRAEG